MPLPSLKIAILHYQPKGDEVDPVVTQLTEALTSLGPPDPPPSPWTTG
jgi:hypothetical protein